MPVFGNPFHKTWYVFMKKRQLPKWVFCITLLCFIIGFFFVQEQHIQHTVSSANSNMKSETLISLITNLETETGALEDHLAQVRQETEHLINESSSGESHLTKQQKQLAEQQIRAGITSLEGPGIVITLDDNSVGMVNAPNDDPNHYVIHYENLLYIVNDLRNAGAEGISINGQRIVVSSEIRCVGNVTLVNTTRLAPPFEISAVGNPSDLEDAITSSATYQELQLTGFPVSYKTTGLHGKKIVLPAYTGSFSTKTLTPVTKGGAE